MKESNIDAVTRETMTFVKQLDIYADIFYIEVVKYVFLFFFECFLSRSKRQDTPSLKA